MNQIEFIKYQSHNIQEWDRIVKSSNSYSFLHERNYMEYHKDRFDDLSFLVKVQDEFVGVIPGTLSGSSFSSHSGLTHGGLIIKQLESLKNFEIMENFVKYLEKIGITEIKISRIPDMYKDSIDDGDLYALIKNGFKINKFSLSQVINLKSDYKFPPHKQRGANKAKRDGLTITVTNDSSKILEMAEINTRIKYGVSITHTNSEMNYLITRFPNNIKCFEVLDSEEIVCGAILYKSKNVNHLQYIAASDRGRKLRSQDFLLENLLNITKIEKKYFSFGSSTEGNGQKLNENLTRAKEEFGAYSIVALELARSTKC